MLERAVVIDPLHEDVHRALMRLFAAAGRRQQALAQYHQLREALSRDLEAEPDPQTGRLYRALLRGEVDPDPPERELRRRRRARARGRGAEPARHNLPIALTSFIGRDRELREVARLLDRSRLLDADRRRWVGEDPPRSRGCDGAAGRVPRRRLAGGAGWPGRPRVGAGGDRLRARSDASLSAPGAGRP